MKDPRAALLAALERDLPKMRRAFKLMLGALRRPPGKRKRSYLARKPWTAADRAVLRRLFPVMTTAAVGKRLGRSLSSCHQQAQSMGLHKDAAYLQRLNEETAAKLAAAGAPHRFTKGSGRGGFHSPEQKKRFLEAGKRTRFKHGTRRGQAAQNWKPIGTVTIDADGYSYTKITEGVRSKAWRMTHVLLWEKHRGKVPRGHAVIFKDKNRRNIRLRNLKLVTRQELMGMNTIHRYPPELKKTIRALGKLRRIIRRKEDAEN